MFYHMAHMFHIPLSTQMRYGIPPTPYSFQGVKNATLETA